tara:strand:+ start:797 stop:1210 length:414 start_codon:yes stop_codon:yes gene_type:complete
MKSQKRIFKKWEYPEINEGEMNSFNWIVQNKSSFSLGYKTDIGAFTYINALEGVTIEDFVQVGSHCSIYSVSTIDSKKGRVILKENCKIGSHSTILPGVTIGKNTIVGANSLVKYDLPPNTICYGIPAKVVKKINEK